MRGLGKVAVVLGGLTVLSASSAAMVVFNLDATINGTTPTGTPPFLIAQFETLSVGSVQLTMTNTMPSTNFVDNWLFNVESTPDLAFNWVSGVAALAAATGLDFSNGGSNMKAGLFDIEFHYPSNTSDSDKFDGGHTSVYLLTGTDLTENSFLVTSIDDTGSPPSTGGWYSAAHVQGFGNGLSGSIGAVPEPASIAIVGIGLVALLRRRCSRP